MQENGKRNRRFKGFFTKWNGKRKVHREVKDRLFRFLFTQDREALLQLYNALNGTDYQDASQLQVVTIENAVYVMMKNDLAFILAGNINMYEHQSTYNANMPLRFLIYLAQEYQNLMEQVEQGLYGSRQIPLPTPQCVVFYNGTQREPEEQILNLSDAFINKDWEADLELRVRMLNINYGHNKELMEKCHVLKEYAMFVDISRQYMEQELPRQEAVESAIKYCIEQGILAETLTKYRAEVLGMILEEFNREKYERTIREDGREEGIEIGQERLRRLTKALIEQKRLEDLERSTYDSEYLEKLYREFHI